MRFIAKTFHGLENILAAEVTALGGQNVQALRRAVAFEGNQELLYKANYQLRCALRILRPIYTFAARSERVLYHKIYSYNWAIHFSERQTFAIDSVVSSPHFRHSKYVALKVKDAIVDQFRKKTGMRPSVDTENPDIRINVHLYDEEFTISLDSSGQSLHRRGYRESGHQAPLNEVLAAGMVMLSGWQREQTLIDPMCGTGTILMEAAMLGSAMPPGYKRKGAYGFMGWKNYDKALWQAVKTAADGQINTEGLDIRGGDISPAALNACTDSLLALGLEQVVNVKRIPFKRHLPDTDKGGILITNPPYGERMRHSDIGALYKMMGDTLKKHYAGFEAWLISSNQDALKQVGLRPSSRITLYNGALECKFLKFSMYKGTKHKDISARSN